MAVPGTQLVQPSRLFGQHDRNAVADRVGELGGARDQLLALAVVFERPLGERADENFEKLRVDARGGTIRAAHGYSGAAPTIARTGVVTATSSRPRSCSWQARFPLTRPGSRRGS